jgi:hypothetical protein
MSKFRLAGEQELIDSLRRMPDVLFPVGQQHLELLIENQQVIAEGIAHLIEQLADSRGNP